jgi:hypothetical protein
VTAPEAPDKFGIALRVGVFAFLEIMILALTGQALLDFTGQLVAGAVSTFSAAATANAITLRIYERGHFRDLGLGWGHASRRNLLLGFAGGALSALMVLGGPVLTGAAQLRSAPEQPANLGSFLFVTVVLFFGAFGEELLFRGYGFQLLLRALGPFATILPIAVLFAAAHANNLNVTTLGLINTFLWGAMLGFCVVRSGDLWLATGVHFGWNWIQPLFGVNLSGFTMGMTGHALEWRVSEFWSGGAYGPEGGILCTIVLPLLAAFVWRAPILTQRLPLVNVEPED